MSYNNISQADAIKKMQGMPGVSIFYVKWTCPECGDRVTCKDQNTFYNSYRHDERDDGSICGKLYECDNPDNLQIGLLVMYKTDGTEIPKDILGRE